MNNNCLYHQLRRVQKKRDKLIDDLKAEKLERELDHFFHKENTSYLKKIIIFQYVGMTVFAISFIPKLLGYY
uniref:Uncharacterized protein n=1 Tax=viral metagenome TaxID=1070528 RepID=A0A6C0H2L3_9ZZZZ